eukprot:3310505-Amphidinium_carterae.1
MQVCSTGQDFGEAEEVGASLTLAFAKPVRVINRWLLEHIFRGVFREPLTALLAGHHHSSGSNSFHDVLPLSVITWLRRHLLCSSSTSALANDWSSINVQELHTREKIEPCKGSAKGVEKSRTQIKKCCKQRTPNWECCRKQSRVHTKQLYVLSRTAAG